MLREIAIILVSTVLITILILFLIAGSQQYTLPKISTINPVLYHFKTQSDSEYKHYGMIAQDVQKVLPNLVGESNNGLDSILTLNYIEFIPILISAVKEQNKIIQSQQAQIDSQQVQINQLLAWAKTQGFQ